MIHRGAAAFCLVAGAMGIDAFAGQTVNELTFNGEVVSRHVSLVNDRLMVPIGDVAKFFGYNLSIANGSAQLTRAAPLSDAGANGLPLQIVPNAPPIPAPNAPAVTPPALNPTMIGIPTTPSNMQPNLNLGLFPNTTAPEPVTLSATLGNPAGFNGFEYTVDSINDAGGSYKTVFDQRGRIIHPDWKDEKLVAIDMSVKNRGQEPEYPPLPGSFGVTVFDDQKVGYPSDQTDVRQTYQPDQYGTQYDLASGNGSEELVLAPGGKLHFAVLASVPKDRHAAQVLLNLSSGGSSTEAGGAMITVNANP